MRELIYQVEFRSDIVLPATSNTEGNIQQLDFIAGSNFLGMVASQYNKFENSFDIFHSGRVRFGDATLLNDVKQTYKMPLSFFYEKLKEKAIYNHHLIKDFSKFDQLKQKRSGYIDEDLHVLHVDYNYSQKSAYDKEHRRSKDSSMFGYSAMGKGTLWQFSIKIDDSISSKDVELIKETITGVKRLGKSKSAQYGEIEISLKGNNKNIENATLNSEMILYANSRLSLVDKDGNPSYDLKNLCDGLKDKNIVYESCQLRTSSFTPYNGARKTKDYERICINKGSVIVLKDITQEQLDSIKNGVGAYLSEGFGDILVNPSFLSKEEFSFQEKEENKENKKEEEIESDLARFLKQREDTKQDKLDILNRVDKFIEHNKSLYKNIKPSQWGKVRSICTSANDNFKEEIREYISNDNFKEEIREYISNGVKKWETTQIETLLNEKYSLEFIKLISIQMPKQGA